MSFNSCSSDGSSTASKFMCQLSRPSDICFLHLRVTSGWYPSDLHSFYLLAYRTWRTVQSRRNAENSSHYFYISAPPYFTGNGGKRRQLVRHTAVTSSMEPHTSTFPMYGIHVVFDRLNFNAISYNTRTRNLLKILQLVMKSTGLTSRFSLLLLFSDLSITINYNVQISMI